MFEQEINQAQLKLQEFPARAEQVRRHITASNPFGQVHLEGYAELLEAAYALDQRVSAALRGLGVIAANAKLNDQHALHDDLWLATRLPQRPDPSKAVTVDRAQLLNRLAQAFPHMQSHALDALVKQMEVK